MIGFFNAYQMTGDRKYLEASNAVWNYIVRMIVDRENGEWFAGRNEDGRVLDPAKSGPWKSSYHNSRMGFELVERLDRIMEQENAFCV